MKTKLRLFLAFIILIVCLTACTNESATDYTATDAERIRGGITVFNEALCGAVNEREWLEKGLTPSAGDGGEWYVMALQRLRCGADFSGYAAKLQSYLTEHSVASATARQKYALTLIACGCKDNAFVISTLNDSIGQQGIMSWIFGLHLLNNGLTSEQYTKEQIIEKLFEMRTSDGGWAVSGAYCDVDVTAMALQALAPYYPTMSAVQEAVDDALTLLSQKQLEDGGFQSYGRENPESTAQVITALCSLGIDPEIDERFIKNSCTMLDAIKMFMLPDGSFCHIIGNATNATATTQVYYAMAAIKLLRDGQGCLYIFDTESVPTKSITNIALNYKEIVYIAAFVVCLVLCAVLYIVGKRNPKNYLCAALLFALVCTVTAVTDIHTTREYYDVTAVQKGEITGSVTMTIRCDTIVGKSESEYIPRDGVILPVTEFDIDDDDTVFDILTEAARKYGIQMENHGSVSGAHGMIYIAGINYLYEFEFGDLSGWVYHVNGIAPSVGCGEFHLSDGDSIEWLYTCDLGNDVK